MNNSGENDSYDWQSSYPKWWWWFTSHHNDHNHDHLDLSAEKDEHSNSDPRLNVNDQSSIDGNGEALKSLDGICRNGKHVGGNNGGNKNSCFYCWRNLSEGAKKPTYKELFEFESSRQGMVGSKNSSNGHSIHGSVSNLNKNIKGMFLHQIVCDIMLIINCIVY